jgi:hypothetical protein
LFLAFRLGFPISQEYDERLKLQGKFSGLLLQVAFSSHHQILLLLREWLYVQRSQMWGRSHRLLAFEQKNQLVLELEVSTVHQLLFEWQMKS